MTAHTPPTEPAGRALSLPLTEEERRLIGFLRYSLPAGAAMEDLAKVKADAFAAGLAAGRRDGAVEAAEEVERRIKAAARDHGRQFQYVTTNDVARIVSDYREEVRRG